MAQVKVKCDNLLTDTNKKVLSLQELTEKMSNKKLSFEKSLNEANAVSALLLFPPDFPSHYCYSNYPVCVILY